MRRHIGILSVAAAIAGAFAASPAHATCMETFNKGGIRQGYCSPPGGPVTSYTCIHDTCVYY